MTWMKTRDDSFKVYVESELLREVDGIAIRRMFDGHGIYLRGIFIGLINGGTLYLKVDRENQKDYEDEGSKRFVYRSHTGKPTTLSFWEVPSCAMDDPAAIVPWVMGAYAAVMRSKKKK